MECYTSPGNFYNVTVKLTTIDEIKGKDKKIREVYLVSAQNTNEAVSKVTDIMKDELFEWEIVSVSISKVKCVYV